MCGICGAVSFPGPLDPAVAESLSAMTLALRHRGPDGQGLFRDAHAALGHRRLAIIDRVGGAQPIANEDGTCFVVLNGEIYNHAALRRELQARGHRFKTASDTEVVVHAYEQFGPAAARRLEGMFALAVYDARQRRLWLARDRLGKKPLFYTTCGDAFHFGSELRALRASARWRADVDPDALDAYLSLGYVPAPRTIFAGVRRLPAGCSLTVTARGAQLERYWDVTAFDEDERPADQICEEIEAQIRTAVGDRLESEVPLGAFLSGGIDSGLVVAAMSAAKRRVTTASVAFAGRAHNELDAAALTARHFDTDHHAQLLAAEGPEAITRVLDCLDEPLADPSVVPAYYVSAAARQLVTVALTGDGGDETFGGYSFRYTPLATEAFLRPVVRLLPARRSLGRLCAAAADTGRVRGAAFLRNLTLDAADAYYLDLCFVKPPMVRRLLARRTDVTSSFGYQAATAPFRRCPSKSALQRAMYADLKGYMTDDVLAKVDRMSMQHGLEVRCPLLDHRLVEQAFRIPARTKVRWLQSKYLLRRLARRTLPPTIAGLPKRGFSAPAGEWLADGCAALFEADVLGGDSATAGLLDHDQVRRWYADHRARRADRGHVLWAIWVLERWARRTSSRWVA